MAVKNSVQIIALTSIDSATMTTSYQSINSSGLPHPCFMIRIVNASSAGVTVSYDGTTDNDFVASNSVAQLPFQANSQPNNYAANLSKGTQVYVKGTAGTGAIYLSGYYQSTGA